MYNLNKDIYSSSFHLSMDTICRGKKIAVSTIEPCLLLRTSNMCQQDKAKQKLFTLQSNSSHQVDTL